jgi:hypothetical protein
VTIRTLYRVPSRSRVVIELFPGTWVTVAGATFPVPGTRVRTRAMYSYQRRCDQIKGRQLLLPRQEYEDLHEDSRVSSAHIKRICLLPTLFISHTTTHTDHYTLMRRSFPTRMSQRALLAHWLGVSQDPHSVPFGFTSLSWTQAWGLVLIGYTHTHTRVALY